MAFGFVMNLEAEGYQVCVAETGQAALERYASFQPALVLLDLRLPDIHGLDVLRRIRARDPDVRVVIVSCLDHPDDRAAGFSAGADDYQIKPFSILELLARIRKQLGGVKHGPTGNVNADPEHLVVDSVNQRLLFRSCVIDISAKPWALLMRLIEAGGHCVTTAELLEEVWHFRHLPNTHTVAQHVANLRRSLHTDADAPEVIITAHGRGYRINPAVLPRRLP